jgi:exodeoxyribonuclease V alpha subunit
MSFKIKARITRELFHKDDYYILACQPLESNREIKLNQYGGFTIVGNLGFLTVDNTYELILKEGKATKYGINYIVTDCPSLAKQELDKLSAEEKFSIMKVATSSDRIAKNVLDAYPNFIDDVVMKSDEELDKIIDLKKIKGVGSVYYKAYKRILRDKFQYFSYIHREELKPYDLSIDDAKKIFERWFNPEESVKRIIENPYFVMIEVCGQSFKKTDNLLKTIRPDLIDSDERCEAVVMDILHRNEEDGDSRLNGNTCYRIMRDEYNCENLKKRIVNVCKNSSNLYYDKESKDLSLFTTYMKEVNIASYAKSANKNCTELDFNIEDYRTLDNGITLTDEQLKAVKNFKKYNFSIIDSSAGSGKSTSAKSIVDVCKALNLTLTILAPTGCAAMRVSETTNYNASTIHLKCLRDREINTDCLLVDECSMVDLDTFSMMLNCINNPNIRIVLMGDINQIPPISVGTVYADLVRSKIVPVTTFTKVFRYGNSGIAYANTNTRQGRDFFEDDVVKYKGDTINIMNDWSFIQRDSDEAIGEEIINQYRKCIKDGYKKDDIIVLSGYNVLDCGTYVLNDKIQAEFNPPLKDEKIFERKISGHGKITFRIGDLVINKKNNYSALPYASWLQIEESNGVLSADEVETTVVFNGQKGIVVDINDKVMVIKFDEELIVFDKLQVYNLLLGRVQTLHSVQGQEGKVVICAITESQSRLLNKNLLYVANSRAKVKHINIGQVKAYKDALKIDGVSRRNTWLLDLLTEKTKNETT